MRQNMSEEFTTEMDRTGSNFTPCFVEMPQRSDGVGRALLICRSGLKVIIELLQ